MTPSDSAPAAPGREEILSDLAAMLATLNGRDYSGTIGPQTRFFADLGLASIDAVVLGEMLQARYNRTLLFGELMADLGSRAERDVSVGEVVDYLERRLAE